MKRRRIIQRRFDHQMDRLQDAGGFLGEQLCKAREQAALVADRARIGVARGRKAVTSIEESVIHAFRKNPAIFILAALGLFGLLAFGRWMARRSS